MRLPTFFKEEGKAIDLQQLFFGLKPPMLTANYFIPALPATSQEKRNHSLQAPTCNH